MCEVSIGGRTLVTYNLHLESRGDDALRCSQLNETLDDSLRYKSKHPYYLPATLISMFPEVLPPTRITQAQFLSTASQGACANDPFAFVVRQGPAHRLDIRARIDSSCTPANSQLSFSFRPLSVVSEACFHVTQDCKDDRVTRVTRPRRRISKVSA